jgi:hypothetical protein
MSDFFEDGSQERDAFLRDIGDFITRCSLIEEGFSTSAAGLSRPISSELQLYFIEPPLQRDE